MTSERHGPGGRADPRTGERGEVGARIGLLLLLACVTGLDALSCAMGRHARVEAVPPTASSALADARLEERAREDGWRERARAEAERASALEPRWIAPRRFLDELDRQDLLAAEALAARLEELERDPDDPALLYLVGRLEGLPGLPRFELARRVDPDLGWAAHGLAWMTFQKGDARAARRIGRHALELARDPWEHATFAIAQARYELALDRADAAVELLERALEEPGLAPWDATEVRVWLIRTELARDDPHDVEAGFWRAIALFRDADLTADEAGDVGARLQEAAQRLGFPAALEEVETALAARAGPGRDEVRGRMLFEHGSPELASGLFTRAEDEDEEPLPVGARPYLTIARIATGEAFAAVEDWRAALPPQVTDSEGMPRRPELAALVRAARSGDEAALAEAMLAAGWFREARALAARLVARDLPLALAVDARAAEGRAVLGGIQRLLLLVDSGSPYAGPTIGASAEVADERSEEDPASAPPRRIRSLDELLAAMQPLFERHEEGADVARIDRSPRVSYGPLATVVHPGPRFTAADEAAGRGVEGEPVIGLSSELLALGRFGLFGQSLGGGGPDGTVLRLLAFEERSGEHLGVPFAGTVAWCEGADVPSRPVRRGARITGAALHEGYWIDVEGVRADLQRWQELEREFLGGDGERARRALAGRGPGLPSDGASSAGPRLRASVYAPLGESDRVRLALLVDRPPGAVGRVTLAELLEATAVHEEGHLTDRTRFLPIAKHPFSALRLLFESGLSPQGVAKRLEYRAELVALCDSADPRMHLAECLDGAEGGGGITPHAAAYTELLDDFLEVLERERAQGAFPALDADHYLLHQLHLLKAEDVRRIALLLARREGMVRD